MRGYVRRDERLSLGDRISIAGTVYGVCLHERGLRCRHGFGAVVDGRHRACGHAGATVDALIGVDVEHLGGRELGLVLPGVNAVHRANIDAGTVLGVDTRVGDDERHSAELTQKGLRCERVLQAFSDMGDTGPAEVQGGLTDSEKRHNVIRLAFGGSEERFEEFLRLIRQELPDGAGVILRGSAVTGKRWKDGAPFDGDGPGTSDLDLTLVGDAAVALFRPTGFFVPGVHSRPVSEDDPDIAPALIPLREALIVITGRPVNIQASREVVIRFRGDLLDQPYLTLVPMPDDTGRIEP